MHTVKVYRLETPEGVGPFTGSGASAAHDDMAVKHRCKKRFYDIPGAWEDCDTFRSRHYCGFRSITQMRRWVRSKPGCKAMEEQFGIRLRVYEVPAEDVVWGREQLGFEKDRALLIEERLPSSIH